jgi:RNA polymerase sigma-70 factor (ECF subfamily)
LAIDHHRKIKDISLESSDAANIPDHQVNIIDEIERNEQAEVVQKALKTLKNDYRDALILRYTKGLSYKEIGHIFGKKSGAVRIMVHRAKNELKKKLE